MQLLSHDCNVTILYKIESNCLFTISKIGIITFQNTACTCLKCNYVLFHLLKESVVQSKAHLHFLSTILQIVKMEVLQQKAYKQLVNGDINLREPTLH